MSLAENLLEIQGKINEACTRSGRNPDSVQIIAVTKYVDIEKTEEVINIGLHHIGENRTQPALEKYDALHGRAVWHFIGSIQSKKVKQIIDKFDYIHSLDRLSLTEEIQRRAEPFGKKIKCFIQVNVSGEESKSGIAPEELFHFVGELRSFSLIEVVGLMTMAPLTEDKEEIRSVFRSLRELRDQLNERQIYPFPIQELSMGMSNDYEIAVEEGATFVRLGSILLKG